MKKLIRSSDKTKAAFFNIKGDELNVIDFTADTLKNIKIGDIVTYGERYNGTVTGFVKEEDAGELGDLLLFTSDGGPDIVGVFDVQSIYRKVQ